MQVATPDIILTLVFAGLSLLVYFAALEERKRIAAAVSEVSCMAEMPTTPLASICTPGYYEVEAVAHTPEPLMAPVAIEQVVWYRHQILQPTVSGTGSSARTTTKVVDDRTSEVGFELRDASGTFPVKLDGAGLESDHLNPGGRVVVGSVRGPFDRVHGIRHGPTLYIRGWFAPSSSGEGLALGKDPEGSRKFLITSESEAERAGRLTDEAGSAGVDSGALMVVAVVLGLFALTIPFGTGAAIRTALVPPPAVSGAR